MASTISAASDAAARGDWPACLTALLAAWRPRREPELAALIDRVSERVTCRPLRPGSKAIEARVLDATEAELGPLCSAIERATRTRPSVGTCALTLAQTRPPDPRIARLLCALVVKPPYAGGMGVLDRGLVTALDAIDDPRFRARIAEAAAAQNQRRAMVHPELIANLDHLIAVGAAAIARTSPPPLDPDAVRAIEEELGRDPLVHGAALLAAIYADPANDAARLVYADLLQEAGDPRGELVALQCRGGSPKRERELLQQYGRAWLGPLDAMVQKSGLVYRRGFVAAARLEVRGFTRPPVVPEWQTVEELDLCDVRGRKVAQWLGTLRVLRRVAQLAASDLPYLEGPLRWTSLGITDLTADSIGQLPALPELVELDLSTSPHLSPLGEALRELARSVQRIRLAVAPTLRGELAHLPLFRPHAQELELVPAYEFIPASPSVILAGDHATFVQRKPKVDVEYAILIVQGLPEGSVRTATLQPTAKADPAARARLERVLAAREIELR